MIARANPENNGKHFPEQKDTFRRINTEGIAKDWGAKSTQKAGEKPKRSMRNTKIEYCRSKRSRGISFSKRKSGLIKKAEELSIISGSQILLVVASETGRVYTYVTERLKPALTQCEYVIYECLTSNLPKDK